MTTNIQSISTPTYQLIDDIVGDLDTIIYGKSLITKQAICCLLAGGHLLIEDLPGMGKTTLAQGLAKILGLDFQRVQFTSDLLPADIIGSSIYRPSDERFIFKKGPLFTQVLLADEINRASPKTQSALLEAMGEYQVSVDTQTLALPNPFFVIATQNPLHQSGTFPLPESQLDRFMMRLSLGYPTAEAERLLLKGGGTQQVLDKIAAQVSPEQLMVIQKEVAKVGVSDSLLDYLQRLLSYTRESQEFDAGLSPRAALSWLHCAKAWALMHQRDYVVPDDLQALMLPVVGHRLLPKDNVSTAQTAINAILNKVDVV